MRRSLQYRHSLTLLVVALALACGGDARSDEDGGARPAEMAMASADAAPFALARGVAGGRADAGDALPQVRAQDSTGARMLIRRGNVFVRVDSLESAMEAVRRLAATLGGLIGDVSISAGEMQVRSATLQVRIPAARFDDAMSGLKPIGRVESSSVSAEDVGEEFVDVNARMANSRRLEDRLVTLLATRTGKLEDVLAVERELARVRQEIERYEGRIRYLRTNVALSTIDVTVSERAPLVSPTPGESVIGEAFKGAWRNFVGLVALAIRSLGILIPLAVVVALLARLFRRRRRHDSA